MAYFLVVLLSMLVGTAVYAATVRGGRERPVALGFDGRSSSETYAEVDPDADTPGAGYTYLRVGTRGPSWQDRVVGFVGLLVLLSVSSAVLALGIYQLGHIVNVTIERFLAK